MVVAVEVGEEEEDPRNFSRLPEKLMSLLVDGEAGATSLRKAKERPRTSFNLIVRINTSFVTAECNITYIILLPQTVGGGGKNPLLEFGNGKNRSPSYRPRPSHIDLDTMRP